MGRIFKIILLIVSFTSCTNSTTAKEENIDDIKTHELLSMIFKDLESNGEDFSCISEKANYFDDFPDYEFNTALIKNLKIKDSSHLNQQLELCQNFKYNEDLSFGKKIVPESLTPNNSQELIKYQEYLDKNCKSGIRAISKPIFNENYSLAFVIVSHSIGGSGEIYEFKNGKWNFIKSILEWIP